MTLGMDPSRDLSEPEANHHPRWRLSFSRVAVSGQGHPPECFEARQSRHIAGRLFSSSEEKAVWSSISAPPPTRGRLATTTFPSAFSIEGCASEPPVSTPDSSDTEQTSRRANNKEAVDKEDVETASVSTTPHTACQQMRPRCHVLAGYQQGRDGAALQVPGQGPVSEVLGTKQRHCRHVSQGQVSMTGVGKGDDDPWSMTDMVGAIGNVPSSAA
ncbi:hypothetical protein BGZ61DRAFT_480572 [Ilyonectria robusta]|uniref:uncharacterized protein n=1 Tax=Ilyonectria robusta TaxID=1079257 RepID=UPI001E8E16AC|nr:uncharacterized protein BGZ61DRAFT_480572 [Ilyonectria robusta]KAH8683533.1 hypothetical protein BGZ61DRAFT_480572 [Ilyonectria robusta]